MVRGLYFDNNATTHVYPEVVKEMNKIMLEDYGNPSSSHALGDKASKIILDCRTKISRVIGAKAHEILFTSGTTESNNWAFSGLAHVNSNKKKILISSIEHPSVRETANLFKNWGYKIIEIPVDKDGFVDINFIEKNIDLDTLFVSVIHGNNIFGTVQDLKKIGDICKKKGTLFHTDAAQTIGKIKILVHDWNIDLLSASAHKTGGPKGIGILYVRDGVKIAPLIYGGGQERGLRSGTENVPGIVGFSKALEISNKIGWKNCEKVRDYIIKELIKDEKIVMRGSIDSRTPNNIFFTIVGVDSEKLLYDLSNKRIYVSIGSACDSKKEFEDATLEAIGLNVNEMKSSIRVSLPIDVVKKDANYFLKTLKELI
ncbi:MAG: cysteine desulfurase family protein [Nanoarchaeota archaeon]